MHKKYTKSKLVIATAITTSLSGPILAEDSFGIKSNRPTSIASWTGFYAGMNSGYNFGTNSSLNTSAWQTSTWNSYEYAGAGLVPNGQDATISNGQIGSSINNLKQFGFLGGAQIGYNLEIQKRLLVGLETDIQGSNTRGVSQANQNFYGVSLADNYWTPLATQNTLASNYIVTGLDFLGTLRLRSGFLVTPEVLVYGTAGLAYGSAWSKISSNGIASTSVVADSETNLLTTKQMFIGQNSNSAMLVGYSAGGGIEWMFSPSWSLKTEALYYNLGNLNNTTISSAQPSAAPSIDSYDNPYMWGNAISTRTSFNYQGIIARAGINYHPSWLEFTNLSTTSQISTIFSNKDNNINNTPDWAGGYVGLNAGYAWSTAPNITSNASQVGSWALYEYGQLGYNQGSASSTGSSVFPSTSSLSQSGFIGGAQAGWNYQINNKLIAGFETDIQGSAIRGASAANQFILGGSSSLYNGGPSRIYTSQNSTVTNYNNSGIDYIGTARARIGYLINPNVLAYGTFGFAYGGAWAKISATGTQTTIASCGVCRDVYPVLQNFYGSNSLSSLLTGYAVGGGIEWMFMKNWSFKTEAIYYNLGSLNIGTLSTNLPSLGLNDYSSSGSSIYSGSSIIQQSTTINSQGIIAKVGVNYHFDLGKPQGVAGL